MARAKSTPQHKSIKVNSKQAKRLVTAAAKLGCSGVYGTWNERFRVVSDFVLAKGRAHGKKEAVKA